MNQILKPGQTVYTDPSRVGCTVEQFLGGGGQGEVYRANLSGRPVALKWYFPHQATSEQLAALTTLLKMGAPNAKFLWPLELAAESGVPGFGYIMPLREPRYKGIVDLMKRRIEPSFRALATAGLELAHSFLQLHAKGLCYRDISFGNVFFDPDTGEVLICDNDNVAVDGKTQGGILGTPRFMAPEVVRGNALPSTQTDLFSLAVLLFYMLMVHHPLEGQAEAAIRCFDLPAMTKLYGTAPVFIFDPNNASNRPLPGYHDNAIAFWPIYPPIFARPVHPLLHRRHPRPHTWPRARERMARRDGAAARRHHVLPPTVAPKTSTMPTRSRHQGARHRPAGPVTNLSPSRSASASAKKSSCSTTIPNSSRTTLTTLAYTTLPNPSLR